MPPDLALLVTLTGSNYPCLELMFMVPKVLEPLTVLISMCQLISFQKFNTAIFHVNGFPTVDHEKHL